MNILLKSYYVCSLLSVTALIPEVCANQGDVRILCPHLLIHSSYYLHEFLSAGSIWHRTPKPLETAWVIAASISSQKVLVVKVMIVSRWGVHGQVTNCLLGGFKVQPHPQNSRKGQSQGSKWSRIVSDQSCTHNEVPSGSKTTRFGGHSVQCAKPGCWGSTTLPKELAQGTSPSDCWPVSSVTKTAFNQKAWLFPWVLEVMLAN